MLGQRDNPHTLKKQTSKRNKNNEENKKNIQKQILKNTATMYEYKMCIRCYYQLVKWNKMDIISYKSINF